MSFGLNLVNQHARMHDLQVFAQCLLAAPVTGDNPWTNLIPYNGCVGQSPVEHNHQLESRMRESRLSGSEGGAILISRPYPYVRLRVRTNSGVEVPIGQSTGCP